MAYARAAVLCEKRAESERQRRESHDPRRRMPPERFRAMSIPISIHGRESRATPTIFGRSQVDVRTDTVNPHCSQRCTAHSAAQSTEVRVIHAVLAIPHPRPHTARSPQKANTNYHHRAAAASLPPRQPVPRGMDEIALVDAIIASRITAMPQKDMWPPAHT
jgi:hypothetical protein